MILTFLAAVVTVAVLVARSRRRRVRTDAVEDQTVALQQGSGFRMAIYDSDPLRGRRGRRR